MFLLRLRKTYITRFEAYGIAKNPGLCGLMLYALTMQSPYSPDTSKERTVYGAMFGSIECPAPKPDSYCARATRNLLYCRAYTLDTVTWCGIVPDFGITTESPKPTYDAIIPLLKAFLDSVDTVINSLLPLNDRLYELRRQSDGPARLLFGIRGEERPEDRLVKSCLQELAGIPCFVTENGFVGVGWRPSRLGDTLVALMGCRFPWIIRRGENDVSYRMIGRSWIAGMMNGELKPLFGHGTINEDIYTFS